METRRASRWRAYRTRHAMKPTLRRLAYFLIFLIWLLVMLFPVVAVVLATQGQIQIGRESESHLRLFLLQESGNEGIGIEWTRHVQEPPRCAQSSLIYLLWEGEGENATYCQCYDEAGAIVVSTPGACRAPQR